MNYKELIGIADLKHNAIAYIPNAVKLKNGMYMRPDYCALYIYSFMSDKEAICGFKNGAREIYNIETYDNEDWICLKNEDKTEKICSLNNLESLIVLVGKIEDNKIYSEYHRQGYIYKNELAFLKTVNLSKEEIDKLPLKDKIIYINEGAFHDNDFVDLNSKDLKEGEDYNTVESIKADIRTYYGDEVFNQFSDENIKEMITDVFYMVDWQHPYSLLDADEYLDGYVEDIGIILNDELKPKMDKLIKKYNLPIDDGIKDSIEVVESLQAKEFSDNTETYKELEMLKVHLYNLYSKEFKENKLDKYMEDLSI